MNYTYLLLLMPLGLYWAYTGFLTVASAQRILHAGVRLPLGMNITARLWFIRGVIGDAIGNVWLGLTTFHELPRWFSGEFMFSSRVQRHVDGAAGWKRDRALEWAAVLNAAVPGHIKRVPTTEDTHL